MHLLDPKVIIETFNNFGGIYFVYLVLFAIIFAESGLLIGFFLPGDSLLFTAGFLASSKFIGLNIWVLTVGFFIAAVAGDSVGYWFGRRVGKRLFHRRESILFHPENLRKTKEFYEKHGKKTIILARFMPVIRTFAPIVAGIGEMEYAAFVTFNVIGGILWGAGLTITGYFLGRAIPDVDKYLLPIVAGIVLISITPPLYHLLKDPHHRKQILAFLKRPFASFRNR